MSGLLSCVASYCPLLLSWSPHVCFTPLMTQHFYLSMESVYIFTFYLIFWIYLGYFFLLNLISVAYITCKVLWEKRASFYNNIITIMVFAPFYKWQTSTAGTWTCSAWLFYSSMPKHTHHHTLSDASLQFHHIPEVLHLSDWDLVTVEATWVRWTDCNVPEPVWHDFVFSFWDQTRAGVLRVAEARLKWKEANISSQLKQWCKTH